MTTRKANDMSHDVPRAPGDFATSGRLSNVWHKCGSNVTVRRVVAGFYRTATVFGNSVWSAA